MIEFLEQSILGQKNTVAGGTPLMAAGVLESGLFWAPNVFLSTNTGHLLDNTDTTALLDSDGNQLTFVE